MPNSNEFAPRACSDLVATIPNGQTVSNVVDLMGTRLAGVWLPPTITGTFLTPQAAPTVAGTFAAIDNSTPAGVTFVGAVMGKYVAVNGDAFYGVRFLRFTSDQAEGADRVITLATLPA
jgi:hypothetical protein